MQSKEILSLVTRHRQIQSTIFSTNLHPVANRQNVFEMHRRRVHKLHK